MDLTTFYSEMSYYKGHFSLDESNRVRSNDKACPITFLYEKKTGEVLPNMLYRLAAEAMQIGPHHADMIAKAADDCAGMVEDSDRFEVAYIRRKLLSQLEIR